MWLGRILAVLHPVRLIVPRHRHGHTWITKQRFWQAWKRVGFHDLKPVLADKLGTVEFFLAVCVVVVWVRAAPSGSTLFTVSTLSPHCWQIHSMCSFCIDHRLSSLLGERLMTPPSTINHHLISSYPFHLPQVAVRRQWNGCWYQLYARHPVQILIDGVATTPACRWSSQD